MVNNSQTAKNVSAMCHAANQGNENIHNMCPEVEGSVWRNRYGCNCYCHYEYVQNSINNERDAFDRIGFELYANHNFNSLSFTNKLDLVKQVFNTYDVELSTQEQHNIVNIIEKMKSEVIWSLSEFLGNIGREITDNKVVETKGFKVLEN